MLINKAHRRKFPVHKAVSEVFAKLPAIVKRGNIGKNKVALGFYTMLSEIRRRYLSTSHNTVFASAMFVFLKAFVGICEKRRVESAAKSSV